MARRSRRLPRYDIVTPTEHEARDDEIARQRVRYFLVWVPCIALVLFGFFVPAPTPWRIAALVLAAPLLPLAAVIGSSWRRPG
ncbi:hypothetical protein [Angustibacter luteus]|uniref:DUF3099 domain-containing protein n=1 Tax=Angustibacter luteus TaxID=658456 RepID=A0ABW1J946_9ACTN